MIEKRITADKLMAKSQLNKNKKGKALLLAALVVIVFTALVFASANVLSGVTTFRPDQDSANVIQGSVPMRGSTISPSLTQPPIVAAPIPSIHTDTATANRFPWGWSIIGGLFSLIVGISIVLLTIKPARKKNMHISMHTTTAHTKSARHRIS